MMNIKQDYGTTLISVTKYFLILICPEMLHIVQEKTLTETAKPTHTMMDIIGRVLVVRVVLLIAIMTGYTKEVLGRITVVNLI
jgi:hypothetical protein